jgi:major membrane immunogen (membrane-anchored lipoprotein)
MLLQKLTLRSKLLGLMVLCSLLTGCAGKNVTIYPIRDTDIRVTEDEVVMSKWYFENVLKVKLEEGR